ncbi:cyclin-dependent protein kinase inhibitor SMR3 [Neltuma alba]|uniref:cyclin-dependent protein kinase inhibitor SMR3 n=1 Tax=Neltuma alba TaxID=207710 RepID=UPI0010A57427|nr:cyclin-dependent protein kinase inhibitor SMR3 [Prosopis alba]
MYSQTLPIFISTMSSSTSDNIFLLRKDQQDTANSQLAERLVPHSESFASNTSETLSTAQEEAEAESCENREESKEQIKLKKKQQEKEKEEDDDHVDDDNDGFRTPTSLDHRIPEAKQCPAPPRKPKPSLKRKAASDTTSFTSSSSSSCRRNPLDLSREVELLLFQTQRNPLSDSHQNPKKSRRQECKM